MTGALERTVARASRRRRTVAQRCDVCAAPLPDQHRHLLDEQAGGIACACRPCFLVLDRQPESGGRYWPIPERRVRLRPLIGADPIDVDVPVGLVFFVRGHDDRMVAHYPSPLGDTQSDVDERVGRALIDRAGPDGLRPVVEAVLVRANSRHGPDEQWLVPIDDCYRLVATIRRHWTGMSGGSAVWTAIAAFFDDLANRTRGKEQEWPLSGSDDPTRRPTPPLTSKASPRETTAGASADCGPMAPPTPAARPGSARAGTTRSSL